MMSRYRENCDSSSGVTAVTHPHHRIFILAQFHMEIPSRKILTVGTIVCSGAQKGETWHSSIFSPKGQRKAHSKVKRNTTWLKNIPQPFHRARDQEGRPSRAHTVPLSNTCDAPTLASSSEAFFASSKCLVSNMCSRHTGRMPLGKKDGECQNCFPSGSLVTWKSTPPAAVPANCAQLVWHASCPRTSRTASGKGPAD